MNDRDRQIAGHILRHCEEAMDTVARFDFSKEKFQSDHVFYNESPRSQAKGAD